MTPDLVKSTSPPAPATCLRCGKRLELTPHGVSQPSIDEVNRQHGWPYCQACLIAHLSEDATP